MTALSDWFVRQGWNRDNYIRFTEADRRAACALTGNPTGFLQQIRGAKARIGSRLRGARMPGGSRGKEVLKSGLEILGPVVPASIIEAVNQRFHQERGVDPKENVTLPDGTALFEGVWFNSGDKIPLAQKAMVPEIVEALRNACGGGFQVISYQAWRTYSIPESVGSKEIYSERWHGDGNRSDVTKVFIFLNDVTRAHGGTLIASREETRAACRAGYRDRRTYGRADEIFQKLEARGGVSGPAGTAYVANTNLCLHRAGIPESGLHRDLLQVMVISAPTVDLTPAPREQFGWIDRLHFYY
jgi:hypothetical protein